MNTNFDPAGSPTHGVLTRILSVLVGVVVLTAAFMFSLVIFAVVAVAGLIFGFYFWWKTRELRRRQMREQAAEQTGGRSAQLAEAGLGAPRVKSSRARRYASQRFGIALPVMASEREAKPLSGERQLRTPLGRRHHPVATAFLGLIQGKIPPPVSAPGCRFRGRGLPRHRHSG